MYPPHEKLVARLEQAGVLTRHWREAFKSIERHRFLPDRLPAPDGSVVDRHGDPGRWLALAYDDVPILTPMGGDGVVATTVDESDERAGLSSASFSRPSVMADILRRLDVFPGMRVLEVGTGTGYGTALLSHRLGDEDVTTIEGDAVVAERARERLLGAGLGTLVITGDGHQGWPARAPFDRVVGTTMVQRVPYHWVAQSRPGGRILTPWGNAFHGGVLADLRVGPNGSAHGHFTGVATSPWGHGRRDPRGRLVKPYPRPEEGEGALTRTGLHPQEPFGDFGASFTIGLHMPTVRHRVEFDEKDQRRCTIHLVDPPTGSRASWHVDPAQRETGYEVRQHGPRRLFTELEAAHSWWLGEGRPGHTRFGLTVSAGRQSVWLDHESRLVTSMP